LALKSLADTQEKEVEFSESSKKPQEREEDSSDLDGDEHEATQEQPRPLRRSIRVRCHQHGMAGKMIVSL